MSKKTLIIYKAHDSKFANHHNDLYEGLEILVRKYILNSPYFDVVFVKNNPTLTKAHFFEKETHTLWFKNEENYAAALRAKVLNAFEYFFITKNSDYKNVFVTNLSTIVNTEKLEFECINNLGCSSDPGFYSWPLQTHTTMNINYYFPSGAGALFTSDLVKKVLQFKNKVNLNYCPNFDDTFIGYALYNLNERIYKLPRIDLSTNSSVTTALANKSYLEYSHIRVKLDKRENELEIHKEIYENLNSSV